MCLSGLLATYPPDIFEYLHCYIGLHIAGTLFKNNEGEASSTMLHQLSNDPARSAVILDKNVTLNILLTSRAIVIFRFMHIAEKSDGKDKV